MRLSGKPQEKRNTRTDHTLKVRTPVRNGRCFLLCKMEEREGWQMKMH